MANKVDDARGISKGCLGGACFTAGTQIVVGMEYDENDVIVYDTVNIEDVQVGDLVYSYNGCAHIILLYYGRFWDRWATLGVDFAPEQLPAL